MAENSVSTTETPSDQESNSGAYPARSSKPRSVATGRGAGRFEWAKYLLSIIILAVGAGLCVGLASLREKSAEQPSEQLVPLISVETIQPYAGQIDMTVSGSVVPYREIKVAAKVGGNVVKKHPHCEAGNFVKAGEPLLEIDPSDFQNQLDIANAELEQSKKLLAENELEIASAVDGVRLAKQDYEIAESNFQRSLRIRNALSKTEFEQAKRERLTSKTQLNNRENSLKLARKRSDRLQASIHLSETRVEAAQTNLQRATVVAPDDGIIVSEAVQEGDFVAIGGPLFTFEDTRQSEVICNLSTRDLAWIRENSTLSDEAKQQIEQNQALAAYYLPKTDVSIYEPDKKNVIWNGTLERFDGIGRNNLSRTIPTLIKVVDPVIQEGNDIHALVRGMFVKCQIKVQVSAGESDRQFLAFPAVALRPGNFVWTVRDNRLIKVPVAIIDRTQVRVGDQMQKTIVIRKTTTSLQPGQQIVVSPIPRATEGLKVQVKKASVADADG